MSSILLVEDNPADAERIVRFLRRREALDLQIAGTGVEGLQALARQPFDFLILDFRLPDINGLELLQTVRRQYPETRVIFLTGFDDDRLFLSAEKLGAEAALSKDRLTESLLNDLLQKSASIKTSEETAEEATEPANLPGEIYRTLIETMNEGMIVADPDQIIIFVNPRMGELIGGPATGLLGRKLTALIASDALASFSEEWRRSLGGETRRYECELALSEERSLPILISQTPSYHRNGKIYGCLLVIADISHQKSIERHLEQLSITDGLTGLFNRRHFEILLEIEFQKSRRHRIPLSCLMLDLDRFKECNDTWGHLFGDAVLKEIARLIRREIRGHDIAARYGGEEFVLLLPNIPTTGAFEVGERIRRSIARHLFIKDRNEHRITVSIGIAGTEDERMLLSEALIRQADRALYRAKWCGRNRVCVDLSSAPSAGNAL